MTIPLDVFDKNIYSTKGMTVHKSHVQTELTELDQYYHTCLHPHAYNVTTRAERKESICVATVFKLQQLGFVYRSIMKVLLDSN